MIANPVYREIVPRILTEIMEEPISLPRPSYVDEDGRLDFEPLIEDFQVYWLAHAEDYLSRAPYSGAAAQLVVMAILHKITNGRSHGAASEYAAGRGRLDLCIRWPRPRGGFDRWAIELKVWRDTTTGDPVARGQEQLVGYLERLGFESGILMVFDARSSAPSLPERMRREETTFEGRRILVMVL